MRSFLRAFKRLTVIALCTYAASLLLFSIAYFDIFKLPGGFSYFMFWFQIIPSEFLGLMISKALTPRVLMVTYPNWLIIFGLGSVVNAILIGILLFAIKAIYFLAKAGDQKIAREFGK